MSLMIPLPLGWRGSLRTAQRPALAQGAVQLLAQRPSALDEQRHVDGLVAHTHLRVASDTPSATSRRSAGATSAFLAWPPPPAGASDRRPAWRPWGAGPPGERGCERHRPGRTRRPPLAATSLETVDGARPRRWAMWRRDSPPAMPREISSRSTSDSRASDHSVGTRGRTPPVLAIRSLTALDRTTDRPGDRSHVLTGFISIPDLGLFSC